MKYVLLIWAAAVALAQPVEVARVTSKSLERSVKLPGEFQPYESVDLHARVPGYVERVLVDRGSYVTKGQLLAELVAPEMKAQIAEAQSKEQTAESQRAEAEARLAAAQSTYDRLLNAARTPGAIAGNELTQAEKTVEAAKAAVRATESSIKAARSSVQALRDLESYLKITAPFSGVVTERFLHPGALAGPNTGPILRIEQNSRLRLVVAVPEASVSGIIRGAHVTFTVPAYPGRTFAGSVARIAHSIDPKTRTMSVELEVANPNLQLAPGMYPEVNWPVRGARPSLLVPATSVVTTTERTFVIRVTNGKAEWVSVKKGSAAGDQIEVYGNLAPGDLVVKRGSDEIRNGESVQPKAS
jgi:membrane fusion protein, multidrug efflux system